MNNDLKNVYLEKGLPYLRPYICNGNPYKSKVCLVGINPATKIYPEQIGKKEYIELIGNYKKFIKYYEETRIQQAKSIISRTRMGINSFSDWLRRECNTSLIETDIFSYPTDNIQELKKVDKQILEKSLEMFFHVIEEFKPEIIILHSITTVRIFVEKILEKKINIKLFGSENDRIENLEKLSPFAVIELNSHKIKVYAVRHFMYYGKEGKSFQNFKRNLKKTLLKK